MITNPEQLEYDTDLYEDLAPRDKEVLYRLFNVYSDRLDQPPITKGNFSQNELRKVLASELKSETEDFLQKYEQLVTEGVRTDPAIEYLAEHTGIEEDNLDVDSRYELLLVLFEEDLIDSLNDLLIQAKIRSNSATRTYIFDGKLEFEGLRDSINNFHQEWNKDQSDPKVVLADIEIKTQQQVIIKVYKETGENVQPTFSFRLNERDREIPVEPELSQISYHQLKTIRFEIQQGDSKSKIVFTESFNGWRRTLNSLFESVFGIDDILDQIQKRKSEAAEEIEREIVDSVEAQEDPVAKTRKKIDDLRSTAKGRVSELDLPEDHREDLKERIETIKISGSEILDDQSIETQEFRLIAALDGLFDSVDGIEAGFREMIKQADEESQAFVLTINDRPVQFSDGTWRGLGPGGLPDRDRHALELFFEDGNEW